MSFSVSSSSRDSIQAIQFELWPDCCCGCKYCYLNGTKRNTKAKQKKENIQDALKTLKDQSIMEKYNAVGLIGGEFFQNQLDDVRDEWIELICYLNFLLKTGAIKEVWIATSLLLENYQDLLMTLSYFDFNALTENQRITLCTSYDTIGRFSEEKHDFLASYSRTFDKNSTVEDVNAFLNTIENETDLENKESNCFDILKEYFPATQSFTNLGFILPDGTLVDINNNTFSGSKIDYYKLSVDGVNFIELALRGAIMVSPEVKDGKKTAELYFAKTAPTFPEEQMAQIIKVFQNYDIVTMRTTCPMTEYNELWVDTCFGDWKSEKYWIENVRKLKKVYPKLSIHTQTILTQDTIEKMIENPDYFDFITEVSSIDFRYPSITRADCPSATAIKDYRSLLLQRHDDFPPKFFIEERATFLKFLKVLRKKYGVTKVQNLVHQPEMRSRRLKIYVDNVEITDRWNDTRDVYLPCGHLVDGLCYIDSPDKCIYCDVEKYLTTIGERI